MLAIVIYILLDPVYLSPSLTPDSVCHYVTDCIRNGHNFSTLVLASVSVATLRQACEHKMKGRLCQMSITTKENRKRKNVSIIHEQI